MMSLIARRFSVDSSFFALRVATLFVLSAVATATQAQVDYYFNPPTGVETITPVNTWDLTNQFWNTANQTTPANPQNNYIWTNNIPDNGLGGELANFGNTAGIVTLDSNISAYGVNFNATGYNIAGGGNVLTLYGPGGPINVNTGAAGNATISAQVAGNVGLTVTGRNAPAGGNIVAGTLALTAANTYSGVTTVTGATLIGNPQAAGSPFSSGAITLNGAILNLKAGSASATSATTVGDLTIGGTTASSVGSSQLIVDDQANSPSVTFAPGNLVRGGSGSALVITPNTGSLGNKEIITFTNGNSLVTNGILPPWVVVTPTAGSTATDFATYSTSAPAADYNHNGVVDAADYVLWRKDPANNGGGGGYDAWRQTFGNAGGGGTGVGIASYSSTNLATSTSTSVVDQSSVPTITGNVSAFALKTNQAINLSGNTLTLGSGSGQSGLILNNGGSITGGNITFGPTEGTIFSQGTTALGSTGNTIASNGLTITGVGATTTTINGNIVDGTAPAKLIYTAAIANSGLVLNGANTYSGGTTLGVNNSAGGTATAIGIGNDSAFGTGKVTNILLPGTSSPIMTALGGDRTLGNAFDLNGGLTFQGSNSFTFTGAFTVMQPQVGGSRTLSNGTTGKTITFGSSVSPSTITLGNPVANGGDGVGKLLGFSGNLAANTTTIINDVMQDPAPGGGTASGSVQYASTGSGGGNTALYIINSQNTYSGTTILQGGNQCTVQFNLDTVGSYPSITSGPFGTGTLLFNNTSNNNFQPTGGGTRVIANPISLNFGYTFNNASGDTTSLMLTGPISFVGAGRTLTNALNTAALVTLGDPNAPSTFTLNTSGITTIAVQCNTTINDVIQDPGGGGGSQVTVNGTQTLTLNAMNTFSYGLNLTGSGTIIPVKLSSNALPGAEFTAGPFGTGTITPNNGTNQHIRATGGDRSISNPISMKFGWITDNYAGETYNLTYAGPITLIDTSGRAIANNGNATGGGTEILGDASAPSTITCGATVGIDLTIRATGGPIVINDVIQNATGIVGNVAYQPNATDNYTITINSANTYTGTTKIGSAGNQGTGQIWLNVSTNGDYGTVDFTSGPLGTGPIVGSTTGASPPPLTPYNADRTLSNEVQLNGNLGVANAPGQTFNLSLTGPISMTGSVSRQITNNLAGTLTLGKSTPVDSILPITLSGTAIQTLTFTGGANSSTVVNDAIQNGGSGFTPGQVAVAGSTVRFNNANSYGPTSPGTTSNTTVSGTGKLLVNNTSGSGTGTGNVSVTGGTLGGTGTISQSVTASGGAIAPGDPLVSNGAGTLNIGGNLTYSAAGGLTVELGGTNAGIDYDQLLVTGTANLAAANGGTFTVSLINGFNPSVDTDFTVLTAAGSLTTNAGAGFGNFAYPDFTHWTTNYTANSVVVHYSAAGGSGSGFAGSTVPEPGTLALLICALSSVLFVSPGRTRRRT